LPQTFKYEAPGGGKCKPKCVPKSLNMFPRRLGNRFPKWLPEGSRPSRESKLIVDVFLASLGALLRAPGALLGWSWDLLGRCWALLGRSWGSCWPPGVHFFKHFEVLLDAGPGAFKRHVFRVCLCLGMVFLVLFLILSCFSRGDPGGQANFEKLWKTIVFFDGFAWVLLLRQVQREPISEHRRTKN